MILINGAAGPLCAACLIGLVAEMCEAAPCEIQRSAPDAPRFVRAISGECSDADRERVRVTADELLDAIRAGRDVEIIGAVIDGELRWDRLPLVPAERAGLPDGHLKRRLAGRKDASVRMVHAPLSIQQARVRGRWSTPDGDIYLAMLGPLRMTGTTFERSMDWSRTAFLGPVDVSDATFQGEAFFMQDLFEHDARFDRTAFEGHTRFHRAVFAGRVSFAGAHFSNLMEALEVTFEQDADWSRTSFQAGTGFSGSHFAGRADFADVVFEREIFFLFTAFDGDASFRRGTFRNTADFSNAVFKAGSDFADARFEKPPEMAGTKISGPPPGTVGDRRALIVTVGALVIALALIFGFVLRSR